MRMLTALMLSGAFGLAIAQPVAGVMDVQWQEGATDCDQAQWEPLQVHAYEPATFILRQHPCAHVEANVLYLLIGSGQALLIDTGAIADPARMPLAETVLGLLPERDAGPMPLVVAHSHGHRDHRAGDVQFASLPSVRVVPPGTGIDAAFGFDGWPDAPGRIDLGGRIVHVLSAPGHHPDHVVFYDERTALLFTGDFLLPGRLLVDDLDAYRESASRIIAFVDDRPLAHILGGHLELDADGRPYRQAATYRPDQGPLERDRQDLLALPAALREFNGFYARHPRFVISHPVHNLAALSVLLLAALAAAAWWVAKIYRRRKLARAAAHPRGN
jgi:hydroxyacylglutathione hydrolase